MIMNFYIQVSNPRLVEEELNIEGDYVLSDILESMYHQNSEKAIITWNNIYIPLSYKYDISIMIDDIIYMLNSIIANDEGNIKFDWPSSTFDVNWEITWDKDSLRIVSHWNQVLGELNGLLNAKNVIQIKKSAFLNEWKMLLRTLHAHLQKSNVEKHFYIQLENLIMQIKESGILYSR
jgi:hypothetical protein